MSCNDIFPKTDHRDIGLGVTFFTHPYVSDEDNKIYNRYTHVPILGYCPGCSHKAHLNLLTPSSSSAATPSLSRTSSAPTSMASHYGEDEDSSDNCNPEYGVLVAAETNHSGPSGTSDYTTVTDSEEDRINVAKYMLNTWAQPRAPNISRGYIDRHNTIYDDSLDYQWRNQTITRRPTIKHSEIVYLGTRPSIKKDTDGDSYMFSSNNDTITPTISVLPSSSTGISPAVEETSIGRQSPGTSHGPGREANDDSKQGKITGVLIRSDKCNKDIRAGGTIKKAGKQTSLAQVYLTHEEESSIEDEIIVID